MRNKVLNWGPKRRQGGPRTRQSTVILVFINARVDTSGRTVDGMPLDSLERFDFDQDVGFETKEDFEKKGFKLMDDDEE